MVEAEIKSIEELLRQIADTASFAQKYGPYYFAVALLLLAPVIYRAVFKSAFDPTADLELRRETYQDFRFYLRTTLLLGSLFAIAASGWWFYEGYRESARMSQAIIDLKKELAARLQESKQMNYTVSGLISDGIRPADEFHISLINDKLSIVFARIPTERPTWFFVLMSDQQLPPELDFNIAWSQIDLERKQRTSVAMLPIRLKVGERYGNYKFSFENQIGRIQPIRP